MLQEREYVHDNATGEVGRLSGRWNGVAARPPDEKRPYRVYLWVSQEYVWRSEEEVTVITKEEYEAKQAEWAAKHQAKAYP